MARFTPMAPGATGNGLHAIRPSGGPGVPRTPPTRAHEARNGPGEGEAGMDHGPPALGGWGGIPKTTPDRPLANPPAGPISGPVYPHLENECFWDGPMVPWPR
jgi:hypothetical protein